MTEIIAQLWALSWWELAWIYAVIQWVALVKFWHLWVAVIVVRVLYWWRWER